MGKLLYLLFAATVLFSPPQAVLASPISVHISPPEPSSQITDEVISKKGEIILPASSISQDDILSALNHYRQNHGVGTLAKDDKICAFAQKRAVDQAAKGGLDSHQGFKDYFADPSHWAELNVHGAGENASWNYVLSGSRLIEEVFTADAGHRDNQLNPSWTLGCAGVSGTVVDIIFAHR